MEYVAINKYNTKIVFRAIDDNEARHWVINHLDLSEDWNIYLNV
jgi:hypothetical protein